VEARDNVDILADAGLLLGTGIAVLRQLLDTKARSEEDVRSLTNSPLLGAVAFDQRVPRHPVILRGRAAETSNPSCRLRCARSRRAGSLKGPR
jgi:hypothetical protein